MPRIRKPKRPRMISLTGKRDSKLRGLGGFTIIEVMMSLVILMAGVIVIDRILISSLGRLSFLEHRFEANRLLANKVWEVQDTMLQTGAAPNGVDDSVLVGSERVYNYAMQSKPVGKNGTLYRADFRIAWTEAGWAQKILRTYYLEMPYEKPAE